MVALLPALGLLGGALQVGPVHLGADPVRTLIHECGIWTLRLLWLTLLITPLRELTGLNDLLRLRRMLGLFAFFYALLHMAAWVWLDQGLDGAVIVSEVIKRPYLALGMTAVLLMVPLAVTSTNAMMRRLRKRWLVLHRRAAGHLALLVAGQERHPRTVGLCAVVGAAAGLPAGQGCCHTAC